MITLYIHGFAGCANGKKAQKFKAHYKEKGEKFFAPSLPYNPKLAIDTLCNFIEVCDERVNLIGSSLGGFYATYLADKYDLKAVLINPSTKPWKTLLKYIPKTKNFCDNSTFEWNENFVEILKEFNVENPSFENFMVLLQTGDEDLDYKIAAEKFKKANLIIEEGGSHSFEGIERYFQKIDDFFK